MATSIESNPPHFTVLGKTIDRRETKATEAALGLILESIAQ
jgi:hypothetical protein